VTSSNTDTMQMFQDLSKKFLEDRSRSADLMTDGELTSAAAAASSSAHQSMFPNLTNVEGQEEGMSSSLTLDPVSFNVMEDGLQSATAAAAAASSGGSDIQLSATASSSSAVQPFKEENSIMSDDVSNNDSAKFVTIAALSNNVENEEKMPDLDGAEAEANALAKTKFILSTAIAREPSQWVRECMETSVKIDELRSRDAPKRIKVSF
jgi:hypothetical protein